MGVIFSTNPLDWRAQDGIFINQQLAPAGARINGNRLTKVVGEFPWGPPNVATEITSADELVSTFFGGVLIPENWKGPRALIGNSYGRLYIVRVEAAAATKAARTIAGATPENIFSITAKYKGAGGNEIKVLYTKVSTTIFDLEITFGGQISEKFAGLVKGTSAFAGVSSAIVDFAWLDADASEALPDSDTAAVALSGGADGTPSEAEYTGGPSSVVGLRCLETVEDGGKVFAANYTSAGWLTALSAHNALKNCDSFGQADASDDVDANLDAAEGISDVTQCLAFHRFMQRYNSGVLKTDLTSVLASIASQVAPNISLADYDNRTYLRGVVGLPSGVAIGSAEYIRAQQVGAIGLEPIRRSTQAPGAQSGWKVKAGITSDPDQPSEVTQRMKRVIGFSLGDALLPYQNKPATNYYVDGGLSAINGVLALLQGTDDNPATQLIEDYSARLVSKTGSEVQYEVRVKLYGEMRYIILNLLVGEDIVISDAA